MRNFLLFIVSCLLSFAWIADSAFSCPIYYDNWENISPSDTVSANETVTQEWRMINYGYNGCDVVGYRLQYYSATRNSVSYDGSSFRNGEYPSFNILSGQTGVVEVSLTAPSEPGVYRVYFDIVNSQGQVSSPGSGGRLWVEFTVTEETPEPPGTSSCPLYYDGWEETYPGDTVTVDDDTITHKWRMRNNVANGCDAFGYHLKYYKSWRGGIEYNGSDFDNYGQYPLFYISSGDSDVVEVTLPVPQETGDYVVEFDIVDNQGQIHPPSTGKRLSTEFTVTDGGGTPGTPAGTIDDSELESLYISKSNWYELAEADDTIYVLASLKNPENISSFKLPFTFQSNLTGYKQTVTVTFEKVSQNNSGLHCKDSANCYSFPINLNGFVVDNHPVAFDERDEIFIIQSEEDVADYPNDGLPAVDFGEYLSSEIEKISPDTKVSLAIASGNKDKRIPPAAPEYFKSAGYEVFSVTTTGTAKIEDFIFVKNQADYIIYVGHGDSCTGKIQLRWQDNSRTGFYSPSIIGSNWQEDLDGAMIFACSVLDINDCHEEYSNDYYINHPDPDVSCPLSSGKDPDTPDPGRDWLKALSNPYGGPYVLLGYNFAAPLVKPGNDGWSILRTWIEHWLKEGISSPKAWELTTDRDVTDIEKVGLNISRKEDGTPNDWRIGHNSSAASIDLQEKRYCYWDKPEQGRVQDYRKWSCFFPEDEDTCKNSTVQSSVSLPYSVSGTIYTGESTKYSLVLAGFLPVVNFNVSWPGSDIDLVITTPNGEVLTPSSGIVVDFIETGTQDTYVVDASAIEEGTWTVEVVGVEIAAEGEPYELTISTESIFVNTPPVADAGNDQTIDCADGNGVDVTLDGSGSSDEDGDSLTYTWTGDFGTLTGEVVNVVLTPGTYSVTLTVEDGSGETATDTVNIVINNSPVADAGNDQTVECTGYDGAEVTLDGSGSFDEDGDSLTYTWTGDFGTVTGKTAQAVLPLGSHSIELEIEDNKGCSSSDTVLITVEDTTPPDIDLSLYPDMLWPANHKMREISADVEVIDICDPNPTVNLLSVSSSESDNGRGDGNFSNDIQNADLSTDDRSFSLRAERSGKGSGRVYSVKYSASDASENTSSAASDVTVPHNKMKSLRNKKKASLNNRKSPHDKRK